jgi:hypothetical protein
MLPERVVRPFLPDSNGGEHDVRVASLHVTRLFEK